MFVQYYEMAPSTHIFRSSGLLSIKAIPIKHQLKMEMIRSKVCHPLTSSSRVILTKKSWRPIFCSQLDSLASKLKLRKELELRVSQNKYKTRKRSWMTQFSRIFLRLSHPKIMAIFYACQCIFNQLFGKALKSSWGRLTGNCRLAEIEKDRKSGDESFEWDHDDPGFFHLVRNSIKPALSSFFLSNWERWKAAASFSKKSSSQISAEEVTSLFREKLFGTTVTKFRERGKLFVHFRSSSSPSRGSLPIFPRASSSLFWDSFKIVAELFSLCGESRRLHCSFSLCLRLDFNPHS